MIPTLFFFKMRGTLSMGDMIPTSTVQLWFLYHSPDDLTMRFWTTKATEQGGFSHSNKVE
jgi:hypothetical protein